MRLPPPPPISDSHFYISGNVTIHPSAVIAPNVLLQADPDSQLTIAEGVCIGRGCVLHAHQGMLEVEAGAILGSDVLILGHCRVGANACIGAASTVFNCSVTPGQTVAAGSLLGEVGRSQAGPAQAAASLMAEPLESTTSSAPSDLNGSSNGRIIYGKTRVERMIAMILPNRQMPTSPSSPPLSSSPDDDD